MGKRFAAILLLVCVFLSGWVKATPIVNNIGSSGEDTLTFNILNLLPSGNPADKLDSAYFTVYKSHNNYVVFRDSSMGVSMAGVDSFVIGGDVVYYFHRAVADIDGAGAVGIYSYNFTAVYDDSGMRTPTIGQFQITGWELDDVGDSTGLAVGNSALALDSLHLILDSLMAVLDTLQNQDNWVSSFDAEAEAVVNTDTTESGHGILTYSGGTDSTVSLKRVVISGDNGTGASLYVQNSSINSPAVFYDANGAGTEAIGLLVDGNEGIGIYAKGAMQDIGLGNSGTIEDGYGGKVVMNSDYVYLDSIANRVLEDSSSYKGIDSTQVAGYVWNTPHANHTVSGTFGKYLDSEISGLGSGSGAYSIQISVVDSSTNQPVPGANLAVRNIDQSSLVAIGATNMQGISDFNLDADSFLVVAYSPGYIFENFDTMVVSGAGVDTLYGHQFDPGTPSDPSLCRVYGYLYDIEGNPEIDARVASWLPAGVMRLGSTIVSPFQVSTEIDENGYFYLDLIPSADLYPDTCKYEITITLSDGTVLRERVSVPDAASWQLTW